MAHVNFVIPHSMQELLTDSNDQYFVKTVIGVTEMRSTLKVAKQCLKDDGPEFILDNFDVYYSMLYHSDKLQIHDVYVGYEHLHRAAQDLHKSVTYLLDDQENLTDEAKDKYANVLKMLMYVYTNMVTMIEQKHENKKKETLNVKKGRKKSDDVETHVIDRKAVVLALTFLMQLDIKIFWNPPIVEEDFVKIVSEVCYKLLENQSIKVEKDTLMGIWTMMGLLITNFKHGTSFIVRMVQLIKLHEHLPACFPEGIKYIIETYHCKSLVRDLVREITEWQCDEKFTDTQGTKNCSKVLSEMASEMPNLMIPEIVYLTQYLGHDSYALRNSVLSVIVEVVLVVLTKPDLSEEDRDSRDELLGILEEHTNDVSPFVRSRVLLHLKHLQAENAIPLKLQTAVLEDAVCHLKDKSAIVRKASANCVTTFLEHNVYSSSLQLGAIRSELEQKTNQMNDLKAEIEGIKVHRLKELEEAFKEHEDDIRKSLEEDLESPTQAPDAEIDQATVPQLVRKCIVDGRYRDAISLCRHASKTSDQFKELRGTIESDEEIELFVLLLRNIFCDVTGHLAELSSSANKGPTEEDLQQLDSLGRTVQYLTDTANFLELIDAARGPMKELLQSTSVGDMHEAVDFLVAAYNFNVDHSNADILEMFAVLQRSEQDRRELVLGALKQIYLTTDSKSSAEHTTCIVNGLIALLKVITYDKETDLSLMISEWTSKGILDNSVIDMLWQYVTKRIDVSDENSLSALQLLTMAAKGRRTIISKNIKLVTTIAFGERGYKDILLPTQACKILLIAAMEKQEITDKNPPFKVKANDDMWQQMGDILMTLFTREIKFLNNFIVLAIDLVFRLCSTPIKLCDNIVKSILNKVHEVNEEILPLHIVTRCIVLLGAISLKQLNFLDETIYKELKRRQYIRDERKNVKDTSKIKKKKKNMSVLNTTTNISMEDSVMEGAQAEDQDAEFISLVLENRTVSEGSDLGKLAHLVITVCERPDIYNNCAVQCSGVTALLRFMLVSNSFCQKHIPLIFTMLEKTTYVEVKIAILIHCSDLLEKCPNVVEPYTPKIFKRLEDRSVMVRKSTLFMLSNLILRDMIRAQGYIAQMARCIIDEEPEMADIAKDFFLQLSHRENNLYNVLPDIFTHASTTETEKNLRTIMTFLFALIDKNKHMENLVDRFCSKFKLTEDEMVLRNIAFSLTLVNYNERCLKKLIENFAHYKHLVLGHDIYAFFKQIISNCSKGLAKNEIKVLAAELDDKIKLMFEISENAVVPPSAKKTFKRPKPVPRKKAQRKTASSGDSDSDGEQNWSGRKTPRRQTGGRRKRYEDSDSD